MSQRELIGRTMARKQSSAGPPETEFVTVAVLPPRLPAGMAPPSGVGTAGVFGWEESINWSHNERVDKPGAPPRKKSFLQKAGITGERVKRNPDLPPFTLRKVPYDVWRKHYAKDKDGNYRGTHAPAEDCLLKPDDVAKWRLEAPKTKADMWTRGNEILPVYAEVEAEGHVPQYVLDHDELAYDRPPPGEPTVDEDKAALRTASTASAVSAESQSFTDPTRKDSTPFTGPTGKIISNGKTAQQIIEEAKNKPQPTGAQRSKNMFKRGAEFMLMGTNI